MAKKKAAPGKAVADTDDQAEQLRELLRGGGRVRGALLSDGEPVAEAVLSRSTATGAFLIAHTMAAQHDTTVEGVRLNAEVARPIEGSDQSTVEEITADVSLAAPRTFLAGEPLAVALPDTPGFQNPEPAAPEDGRAEAPAPRPEAVPHAQATGEEGKTV